MRVILALLVFSVIASAPQQANEALRATGTIPMPAVEGRIDHLAADVAGQRVFLAALGNNTLEVLDLKTMKVARSIAGLDEPQGIRFLADRNRVVVANGGNGAVIFDDGTTLAVGHQTKLSGDADNVRYDQKTNRVYVGYASGALAVLDSDGKTIGDVKLAAHPESFQLEAAGPRIFVNVPGARQIAVVDRDKQSVVASWPVTAAGACYPMALDEATHRLFTGCRQPAKLLVLDMATGSLVTSIDIVGDTDDLFYDSARKRLYVIGGEGFVTVLQQQDADHYRQIQKLQTAAGARTGLFVPELGKLFVAVPHRGAQRAEVRVFDASSQ